MSKLFLGLVSFLVVFCLGCAAHAAEAQSEEAASSPTPAAEENVVAARNQLDEHQAQITAKKDEIAALDKKISELRAQRDTSAAEASIISNQLQRLEERLTQAELELAHTQLALRTVDTEKKRNETAISELAAALERIRDELRGVIRELYIKGEPSFMRILLSSGSLSQALAERAAYMTVQTRQTELLTTLRRQEEELQARQTELAQQEEDLGNLQQLLAGQQEELDTQQQEQQRFLQAKRAQQVSYEAKLAEASQARQEIEQDVFTLKNAGVKLTLTEATDMARYAEKLTGVRAALLLGVLKVETNLGTNLGSGTFPDDMHPAQHEAFTRIIKKLGLDLSAAPISARPRSFQGWGGAMGPGQFMPTTWEGIEVRVASLMQKPTANPYELTDAFVATALFLADHGATDRAREYEAVNRYLAGPNWQRFTWYGDRVLAVAAEYEKEGL